MKPFTLRDLRNHNWSIPNLHSDYTISEDNIGYLEIKYLDNSLVRFNKSTVWNDIPHVNYALCVALGLRTSTSSPSKSTTLHQVIDSLYYLSNPYKIGTKAGNIFKKTFSAIDRRFRNSGSYNTAPVTLKLVGEIDSHFLSELHREGIDIEDTSSPQFRRALYDKYNNAFHYVKCCYFTNKVARYYKFSYINCSDGKVYVHDSVTPADLGYSRHQDHYNIWLLPNEILFDNEIVTIDPDNCTTCPECNRLIPNQIFDTEENACKICVNQRYQIHNYSTRVPQLLSFKAKKVTPKTIYFGIELEYETTDREEARVKVGKLIKGHAIMKSDGSIRNGFEIVTCPATEDIHLEEFKRFFDNKPPELKTANNVGMHVHISRSPLNLFTVGKVTEFLNKPDNIKFIEFVGGRSLNSYCNYSSSRTVTYPLLTGNSSARYNTVNLCNRDTIELRFFATPITYDQFASRMQFCKALVDYCSPAAVSKPLKQLTNFQSFIDWVMPQRKVYPELVAKIKEYA